MSKATLIFWPIFELRMLIGIGARIALVAHANLAMICGLVLYASIFVVFMDQISATYVMSRGWLIYREKSLVYHLN